MAERIESTRSFRFSHEVRAGDLLNIAGFIVAAFAAWSAMDTRITKVEEKQFRQTEVTTDIRDNIREIKTEVKETNASIRALEGRVARKGI